MPVDYDALAAQHGGTAVVDYDALAAQHGGTSAGAAPQEGFLSSLAHSVGLPGSADEVKAMVDDNNPLKHPGQALLKAAAGPAGQLVPALVEGAKRSGSELFQASKDAFNRNRSGAAYHAVKAIPIVGPGMDKAADQYAEGNYAGEAGTLLGTAGQVAPMVLGTVDAAGVPRPDSSLPNMMDKFPTKAKAGQIFNDLNAKLKEQPVPLTTASAPLLRATEVAARGGTMPSAVNALLQRSQAIEPMTFPEIRDYQAALSDLSASDKMAMNGRMKGAVAQLSHALYQDIRQAAETQGMGADYDKAMSQYRRAATARDFIDRSKDVLTTEAVKGIVKGAGLGAGGAIGYQLYKQTQ